jgi:hypothetical protein
MAGLTNTSDKRHRLQAARVFMARGAGLGSGGVEEHQGGVECLATEPVEGTALALEWAYTTPMAVTVFLRAFRWW